MSFPVALVLAIVESFLLGSIPFGVIVAKVGYGKDPRDGGSGSIGMTNMARLFGVKAAAITFVGDAGKGALALGIVRLMLPFVVGIDAQWQIDLLLVAGVVAAIFGHVYCPWLGFKGGKGISTGFGSILVAFPLTVLCMLAVFLVVAFATKRISAGSICAAIAFPLFSCVFTPGSVPVLVMSTIVAAAVVYAHRGNIKRMVHGEEPKFSFHHDDAADAKEQAHD